MLILVSDSKKIVKFEKIKSTMKLPLSLKASLLAFIFILSSCATVKYGEDTQKNNYSNLQTGKNYVFTLRDGGKQKMLFSRISGDEIIGFASKKDSTVVTLAKGSVSKSKDVRVANGVIAGAIVGTAAVAAIVLSSTRATK